MSICCLEKQLSVCEGIWGPTCPPPNTFPWQDKEGERICRNLKLVQVGESWDGGCWGEERKGDMVRVGGMQWGGRICGDGGEEQEAEGGSGGKEPFGN